VRFEDPDSQGPLVGQGPQPVIGRPEQGKEDVDRGQDGDDVERLDEPGGEAGPGDEGGIRGERQHRDGPPDAVGDVEVDPEVPLVQQPEAQRAVEQGGRGEQPHAGQGRAKLGDAALDREPPAGQEENGHEQERTRRLLVVQALGQVEDDRQPRQQHHQDEGPLLALQDLERGHGQGETDAHGQEARHVEEFEGKDVPQHGHADRQAPAGGRGDVDDPAPERDEADGPDEEAVGTAVRIPGSGFGFDGHLPSTSLSFNVRRPPGGCQYGP
jgi:hypothetical protein